MRKKVEELLEGKGISKERIREAYEFIKQSGRYTGRMPSHYLAIAIELIERDRHRPGAVQIYISPKPTRHALGRPSVTFAVLAPDWPGLLNSCTGTLHEKGFNIAYCEAVVIEEPERKLGIVFMEIDVSERKKFEHLLAMEKEIEERLLRAAARERGKDELLIIEARKAEQYSLVVEELKKIAKPEEYDELFGEKGEAVRFFAARTFAYLTERTPQALADQIYTNYTFIKKVRETGEICVKVGNVESPAGELTGISIAGYEHDLSLGDCFRVIDEVVPGYQRKYDKAFITDDGINVFRIEIVDAKGASLNRDQHIELSQKLASVKDAPTCDRISPGVELIGRKICPAMLEEERQLKMPQVYMHPHSRSNIKVVLVTSGSDRGHAFDCVRKISEVQGLEAAMPDPPSLVTYGGEGSTQVQEVAIIDVWVNFASFFGKASGPYNDELIFARIEEALRKADGIGPRLRIFDRTSRQLRAARTERICAMAKEKGFDADLARQVVLRLGDKQIISPTVSDDEIFEQVVSSIVTVEDWKRDEEKKPHIRWRRIEMSSGGRGSSYTFFIIVHAKHKNYLSRILQEMTSFGIESSSVLDGDDFTMLLFRLSHQGRALEDVEISKLTSKLEGILGPVQH